MTIINLKRKGLTLIETILVLGIVALVIGGLLMYYAKTLEKERVHEAMQEILSIRNSMSQLYGNLQQSNGDLLTGFKAKYLVQSGLIPKKYQSNDGNSLISPWKQSLTVTNNGGRDYAIYFYHLSNTSCVGLLNTINSSEYRFIQITYFVQAGDGKYYTPLTPKSIINSCNQQKGDNQLVFVVSDV